MIALAGERRTFEKGVGPEWGSYTPLHPKSNLVPNPLHLKEWSVAYPLHCLKRSELWSGVSRSEPVSGINRKTIQLPHQAGVSII